MAVKTTKRISARQAAVNVLEREGKPLKLGVIAEEALKQATHLTSKGGSKPLDTIKTQVILAANRGRYFKKVAPGVYDLLDAKAAPKRAPRKRAKAKA